MPETITIAVPTDILRSDLNMSSKLVYAWLLAHHGDTGCTIGQPDLAAVLGINQRTVVDAVKQLTDAGLLEVTRIPPSNRYRCLPRE